MKPEWHYLRRLAPAIALVLITAFGVIQFLGTAPYRRVSSASQLVNASVSLLPQSTIKPDFGIKSGVMLKSITQRLFHFLSFCEGLSWQTVSALDIHLGVRNVYYFLAFIHAP